jgi:hypothetical protein
MARNAASTTAPGPPTNVTTVRLVAFARINIQQANTLNRFNFVSDLFYNGQVIAFTEIGNTFYDLHKHPLESLRYYL